MSGTIYDTLGQLGFHHPLHPALVHLPLGLVMGGLIFILIGRLSRREPLARTARHCMRLALVSLPVAVAMGYADWIHFFGGAWLMPIKAKIGLAVILFLLVAAAPGGRKKGAEGEEGGRLLVYFLAAICAGGIGYFGGELVYGKRAAPSASDPAAAATSGAVSGAEAPSVDVALVLGQEVFAGRCGFCHHADSAEIKVGPGLKGLTRQAALPTSGWPMTDENLLRQIKTPFDSMPAIDDLTPEEEAAVLAYLKSL
jgi:mono/diheme cytochrome c family protein